MCQGVLSKWEVIDQEVTIFKCGGGGSDGVETVRFVLETAPGCSREDGLEGS